MKRQIAQAAMVLGVILIAYNIVDRIEQHTEAVIASEQAFRDGCLPRAGEMAIIVSNGRSARCRIYSSNSTGSGMASKMVSAAVIEVNP